MSLADSPRQLTLERLEDRQLLAITFAEHIIDNGLPGVASSFIYPADMDNDGDIDLVFATADVPHNTVGWYENSDGRGNYTQSQAIEAGNGGAAIAIPADLDSDGDMDVLNKWGQQLVWFENTDGQGHLGESQFIGTPSDGWPNLKSIYAADLDGDGDVDALSASYVDDRIAWYGNLDGHGSAWHQEVITTQADGAALVHAADMDGDGDVDVISVAANRPATLDWHENLDGNGHFGLGHVVFASNVGFADQALYTADLDGDGDMDLLSAGVFNSTLAWHENTDGRGTFGSPHVIARPGIGGYSVYAADLDNDGDLDVIASDSWDLSWYENTDGKGTFGRKQIVSDTDTIWAHSVHAIDADGDGDIDIVCASQTADATTGRFTWYENLTPHPVPGDANQDFQFNQADIVKVLQTAKYLTGQPATWQEGDWNDDGVFDQLDIVAALQTGSYLQGPYAAHTTIAGWATLPRERLHPVVDEVLAHESELDDLLPEL